MYISEVPMTIVFNYSHDLINENLTEYFFKTDTNSTDKYIYYKPQKDYYWLFLVIIGIWIFIGNFIVVLLILKYKQIFNNNTTKIILSLSVTDLCLSIFVLPFALYTQVNRSEWNLGYYTCLLWLGFDMQLTTTSIFHLVSI